MSINSLLPLLAAIAYIPLIFVIATNRPWHKQHLIFALFLSAGVLWSFFSFLMRSDFLQDYKLIIFKFTICSLMWLYAQFYYFIRYYLFKSAGFGTYLGYAAFGAVIIGSVLGYVPQSFSWEHGIVTPSIGLWGIPIILIPTALAGSAIYHLIRKYRSSHDPIERNRIIYLVLAVALLAIFSFINSTDIGDLFPTAQIGQLANSALLTYATLKFKILDMNMIIRRGFVYGAMNIICLVVFAVWFFLINLVFNTGVNLLTSLIPVILTGITVSIFWTNVLDFLFYRIDAIFYGESYDYRRALSTFIRRDLTRVFSLDELFKGLLPILSRVLDCKYIYVLLPESGSNDFVATYIEPARKLDEQFVIRNEGPIPNWLKQENRYLNVSEIDIMPNFRGLWKKEKDEIKKLEIELFFPLISRGNLVGILALSRKRAGKYTLDETNLIENMSSQTAISIEKEYIQLELRRDEQELSLINRLTGVMTSSLNINEVYDVFVDGLREVINIDFASVTIADGKELILTSLYSDVGWAWAIGESTELKGTPTEWVLRHKKSLYEPDLEQDSMFSMGVEYLKRGIKSVIYLPLITKGEVIGSLNIASKKANDYVPIQRQLLERLASQISTSIINAQLYSHAEQRARIDELTGLFNRRHFDESLKQEVNRHSRYGSMLSVAFLDLDNFKTYNDTMGHRVGDKLLTDIGRLIKETVRNIDSAYRYGGDEFAVIMPHTDGEDAFGVSERIRVKITNRTRTGKILITVSIGLATWPSDGLTPDDLVNAADKALYYAKQTGGNRTCQVSQMLPYTGSEQLEALPTSEKETLHTIYALSATIEARDPYTYGHSRKVRAYAVALAECIGLPSEKVAAISHAALLHDIGKIGVVDEILKKKGSLDAHETQSIRYHPQLSKTIVGHVSSLTPCLPSILHHHERWDGTGYPSGLKEQSIPLEARILAVADAFDAMTSLRPYRAPLTYKEAIAELKRCSGTQFDPNLVDKFIPIALTITPDELEMNKKPVIDELD